MTEGRLSCSFDYSLCPFVSFGAVIAFGSSLPSNQELVGICTALGICFGRCSFVILQRFLYFAYSRAVP